MPKYALLIASSQESNEFSTKSVALNDLEAMHKLLEKNNFIIDPLPNPNPQEMRVAVEQFAENKERNDLLLFYYSGHGLIDHDGELYFSTNSPFRKANQELLISELFPSKFLQKILILNCLAKQIIIILDCCYSAAFGQELSSKDSEDLLLRKKHLYLGEKQWVCLSSSSTTERYIRPPEMPLSPYTDSLINVFPQSNCLRHLHDLIQKHLQESNITLRPQIYACDYNSLNLNLKAENLPKTHQTNISKGDNNIPTPQIRSTYGSLSHHHEKIDREILSDLGEGHGFQRMYNPPLLHKVKLTSQETTMEISDLNFEQVKELWKLIKEEQ